VQSNGSRTRNAIGGVLAAPSLSAAAALEALGGENPFSLEAIQDRRRAAFPDAPTAGLTKREQKIFAKAREDALVIGLAGVKGALAAQAMADLEDFANASYLATSTRMARRMAATVRLCPSEEIRALQVVFTTEGARRMGAATVGIVDSAEGAIQEAAARPLSLPEDGSLFRLLFGGRR
jgi:hypothetical protein